MAYNLAYYIPFLNNERIACEVKILGSDYAPDAITLQGAEKPFTLNSTAQDNQIPYGIKATEAVIEFYTNGLVTIEDLYTEIDAYWKVEFYVATVLEWTGFLQIDNCSEQVTDTDHILSLNANDGLGRLEKLYFFDDSLFWDGRPIIVNWKLTELLSYLISSTGLLLNIKAWLNIYENTTEDRSDFDYLTFLPQTTFSTKYFVNKDGSTASLYEALNIVLLAFRCMLTQAGGCWQIIRWGDVWLWQDGEMPGTLYDYGFATYELILFPSALNVGPYSQGFLPHPINENQVKTILPAYKYSKETFNYEQPPDIVQADLQIAADAVPFDTNTVGDFRYDDYDIATYFPDWVQRDGDASYLQVVTNISVDPEQETERYIITPDLGAQSRGVQFNPISISTGDVINFSVQYRTESETNDEVRFGVRFILVTADDIVYNLINFPTITGSDHPGLIWDDFPADEWDQQNGVFDFLSDAEADDIDTREWRGYDLDLFLSKNRVMPPAPANGMLLIQINGTNAYGAPEHHTMYWKDISLGIKSFTNSSVQIVGQVHTTTQAPEIKNNEQYDVQLDDSPRRSIRGTLFTDELTGFEYTDSSTGEDTDIGDIYFTLTSSWHRGLLSESRRLGYLNTYNDLFIQQVKRLIVTGDFYGLGVNLLSTIRISWLPTKTFILGATSIDYMSCIWNASLYEIFDTDNVVSESVFMSGSKNTDTSVTTAVIHFDAVTYYNGAEDYISDSDTLSKFTYDNGFNTTADVSVIFYVPISGSGTATFTVEQNGVVIATRTLNASAHFGLISFDLRGLAVTGGDYFQAFVDIGTANVDIQSGSINITVNNVIVNNFDYTFNYLYDTAK